MHICRTLRKGAEGFSSRYWIEGVGAVSSCAPDDEEEDDCEGPCVCGFDGKGGCCCRGCEYCDCCEGCGGGGGGGGGCDLGFETHTLPSASALVRQSSNVRIERSAAV